MNRLAGVALLLFGSSADAAPAIFVSTTETTQTIPMTTGEPYMFWSAYVVAIPNLVPTDIVQCHGQAEVTNNRPYAVQIDRAIGKQPASDFSAGPNSAITTVNPLYGENVTLEMHHMTVDTWGTDTGENGTVYYSLILEAASNAAVANDAVVLEHGYGGIWCTVFH